VNIHMYIYICIYSYSYLHVYIIYIHTYVSRYLAISLEAAHVDVAKRAF